MTTVEFLEKSGVDAGIFINTGPKPNSIFLLENIEKIRALDEFKNVKRINILEQPIYQVNPITLELATTEDYLWETLLTQSVVSTILGGTEFNEVIDIYDFELTNKTYDPNQKLGCGVWNWPLLYNPTTFGPYRKIEVIFSPEQIQSFHFNNSHHDGDEAKKIIMKRFEEALDSRESNIPSTRDVIIRCSPRSIKKQENEE